MRQNVPLWSDTLFIFFVLLLAGFCILRFYIGTLWLSALLALLFAAALTALTHLWLRARRAKKHAGREEQQKIEALAFHLAMDSPAHNAELIARCMRAAGEQDAHAEGETVVAGDKRAYLRFRLEKVTADELSPVIRAEGGAKEVLAGAYTEEAQKLAGAFGVTLLSAPQVYALVAESGQMPEQLIAPPQKKQRLRDKLQFRIRRDAWRGYAFSGAFLLLFSLLTVFPLYYIISGGILLGVAVLVRFLGK